MTRVSKKYINKKIILKLYRLFFEVFLRSNSQQSFLSLIDDILSPTEKVMIAKRLGMVYLLIKGVDFRTIADTLKVSTSTVLFYSVIYKKNKLQTTKLIEQMLKKEKVLNFLEDLFADLMIRPGIYIGHHQLKYEHEKKKEGRKILPP